MTKYDLTGRYLTNLRWYVMTRHIRTLFIGRFYVIEAENK